MVVAPAMTWLLVSTSPVLVMIIPVPWSSEGPPKRPPVEDPGPLASMATTSGKMLFTIVGIWAPPASAGPGATWPIFTAGAELSPLLVPTASAIPAPTPPRLPARSPATTSQLGTPRDLASGVEASGGVHGHPGAPEAGYPGGD